jgi:hypothetical protein
MVYIDTLLLDFTERVCRAFQRLTGRTNVWLAGQLTNLSIVVFFVWAVMYSWQADFRQRLLVALFCGALLYLLTKTVFKEPIEAYETDAYRRVSKGLRNPRRLRDAPLRTAFLTLSVVLMYPIAFLYLTLRLPIVMLSYALVALTTVMLYVLACDPLPPCVGRVARWLRRPAPAAVARAATQDRRQVRRVG